MRPGRSPNAPADRAFLIAAGFFGRPLVGLDYGDHRTLVMMVSMVMIVGVWVIMVMGMIMIVDVIYTVNMGLSLAATIAHGKPPKS
jgi:hypothetical protein